jgi:rare lipoprotein A
VKTSVFISRLIYTLFFGCLFVASEACTASRSQHQERPARYVETGKASFYADLLHGRLTANGERYDKNAMTAAHRSLPFGTRITVTNLTNGKQVTLRVNDRGPFVKGRIVDVSKAAAKKLGMLQKGVVNVRLDIR